MFRLRTTASLSLLALAIGAAGTAWLSTLTDDWTGPAAARVYRDKARHLLQRHARPVSVPANVAHIAPRTASVPAQLPATPALPTLTPIDMPSLPASLFQRAVFVSGRVVLKLDVDGSGHVDQASIAESSGNPALDDRAVRTVQHWRFAVPNDHPQGLRGTLVMRFDDTSPL